MTQTLTTERQQFEEWVKFHSDEEECTNLLEKNNAGTNYLHPHTDLAWIAWKTSRELLANREALPSITDEAIERIVVPLSLDGLDEEKHHCEWHLYHDRERIRKELREYFTAPPAPVVPPEKKLPELMMASYHEAIGWNACRAAMLAQPVSQGYKLVPVEPTKDMIDAGWRYFMGCKNPSSKSIYAAMLAAAPEGGNDA